MSGRDAERVAFRTIEQHLPSVAELRIVIGRTN